jgi:hypothetical protein
MESVQSVMAQEHIWLALVPVESVEGLAIALYVKGQDNSLKLCKK